MADNIVLSISPYLRFSLIFARIHDEKYTAVQCLPE